MRLFGSERVKQEEGEGKVRLRSRGTWLGGLVVVCLILTTAGAVTAQSTNQVITGCVQNKTGLLKIITSGTCNPQTETDLSWNKEGQEGPQGPQGEQGPSGVSGYEIVKSTWEIPPEATVGRYRINAECPSGKSVLGGGASGDNGNPMEMTESFPLPGGSAWVATVRNTTSTNQNAIAYAICANVALP